MRRRQRRFMAVLDQSHWDSRWRVIDLKTMTWSATGQLWHASARREARRRNKVDRMYPDRVDSAWPDMIANRSR